MFVRPSAARPPAGEEENAHQRQGQHSSGHGQWASRPSGCIP